MMMQPLESINEVFQRLKAGDVKGRVVLGMGGKGSRNQRQELKVTSAQGRHQFPVAGLILRLPGIQQSTSVKGLAWRQVNYATAPRYDNCPDSVSALRPPHPTYVAGAHVTENRFRCLHFNATIRGIRVAI